MKKIVLGICGGIAAYKSAQLVRLLREAGCEVRVVMTASAEQFVTPLTLSTLSAYPVLSARQAADAQMPHIALARWADQVIIAPTTAATMARLAHGLSEDLLSELCLATTAPITLCPAMNQQMWLNSATQANQAILQQRGFQCLGPDSGALACGEVGPGRLVALEDIVNHCCAVRESQQRWLITAGPTQEPIDPVRYISNRSSGKMGYALAAAAQHHGAQVTLISGPCALTPPVGVKMIQVETAQQMQRAVEQHLQATDVFVSVAAVCDYRVAEVAAHKMKKQTADWQLNVTPTVDILHWVGHHPSRPTIVVGFAAETENLIDHARLKLQRKRCDAIIANQVGEGLAFDQAAMQVVWLQPNGVEEHFSLMSKPALAKKLVDAINQLSSKRVGSLL